MTPNGEVETVNRQITDYFGRPLEWLKNWGANDAVHPEDLPRIAELFKKSMAAGIPFQYELRLRRFDGEYRWFDNRGRFATTPGTSCAGTSCWWTSRIALEHWRDWIRCNRISPI
jgi:PAS domain-containing protein